MYTHMHTDACIHLYVHIYIHMYIYVCLYIYIHIYVYMYIHVIHLHIYAYKSIVNWYPIPLPLGTWVLLVGCFRNTCEATSGVQPRQQSLFTYIRTYVHAYSIQEYMYRETPSKHTHTHRQGHPRAHTHTHTHTQSSHTHTHALNAHMSLFVKFPPVLHKTRS